LENCTNSGALGHNHGELNNHGRKTKPEDNTLLSYGIG